MAINKELVPANLPASLQADYIDMRVLLRSLRDNKRSIIFITAVIFILAMTCAIFRPVNYQATVLLQIHHKRASSLGSVASVNSQSEDKFTGEPASVHIALIRSKYILDPVIQSLKLADKKSQIEIIRDIRSHLTITDLTGMSDSFPDKPGILQVSMTGKNPDQLVKLVNTIAQITQTKDAERKFREAEKTLQFLNQQLPLAQNSLREAENSLAQFRANHGKINIKLQMQNFLTELTDVNNQLEKIRLRKIDLMSQYTSLHPSVIALLEKSASLEKQRGAILNKIKQLSASDQIATELQHDITVRNDLVMHLLNRIHEQQVVTAGIVSDIGILSLATSADKPRPLSLPLIAFASVIIGMLLGCMGVMGWKLYHHS